MLEEYIAPCVDPPCHCAACGTFGTPGQCGVCAKIAAAVATEREACAKIADDLARQVEETDAAGRAKLDRDPQLIYTFGFLVGASRSASKIRAQPIDQMIYPIPSHRVVGALEAGLVMEEALAAERERCAKIVENFAAACPGPTGPDIRILVDAAVIAAKIREGVC